MVSKAYHLKDSNAFLKKALHWASKFENVCYLDSNGYQDNYGKINVFIAVGAQAVFNSEDASEKASDDPIEGLNDKVAELPWPTKSSDESHLNTFDRLQAFVDDYPGHWIPGFLNYDLKNELESLSTSEPNRTGMPDAYFFVPTFTLLIGEYNVEIKAVHPDEAMRQIEETLIEDLPIGFHGEVRPRMSKDQYLHAFHRLHEHLQQGDCYEVNLCQEFFAEQAIVNPVPLFEKLKEVSPTPFCCFFKVKDRYILSASPERFLSKQGTTLLSQPIKGTAKRGQTAQEDDLLKKELERSEKEISENIMIVDLVRNDLTKSAKPGTVKATELTKVYSFRQVHQLISTVTCELSDDIRPTQAIAHAFPPGSMTGAPKIKAMELIDRYENSRRGVYSGAIGYFSPQGNFDFSVVIRTILYHAEKKYLSFHTGGAITLASDPEQEYNECLLKGKAMFEVLKG
jgi:para-aminobenzoate synthetase component 1